MKYFFMSWVLGLLIGFLTVIIIFLFVMFSLLIYKAFGLIVTLIMLTIILSIAIVVGLREF